MSCHLFSPRSRATAVGAGLLALLAAGWAQAQTGPQAAPVGREALQKEELSGGRSGNQKIEHIRIEDGGATVDELRVGGRTQNIQVKPKGNAPAYEVLPNDGAPDRQGRGEGAAGSGGPRVWNVLKF